MIFESLIWNVPERVSITPQMLCTGFPGLLRRCWSAMI
jgi:hypothetical protein